MGDLATAIANLRGHTLLVVGDLILDEYVSGTATRVSREAPVIVVEESRRDWLLGGAAMPSLNVVLLGSAALHVGVVGSDEAGQRIIRLLETSGVDTAGVLVDPSRRTTTKTRIVAEGFHVFPQQVARIDRLDRHPLDNDMEAAILDRLAQASGRVKAVLVSDYKNGSLTAAVVQRLVRLAAAGGLLLSVDSQGDLDRFAGFGIVKCNHHDAATFVGHTTDSDADVEAAIDEIQRRLGAREVVITRANRGMSYLSAAAGLGHLPAANQSEVFDVTGAGDTVISVLTLARLGGVPLPIACSLANLAAGVVIRKRGNQPITSDELAAVAAARGG